MDLVDRFQQYAAAFEEFFESDDARTLEPFFCENAVYEITGGEPLAGRHEGRDAVIDHLRSSLQGFDKRFDSRQLELLEGPALRDGAVWLRWRASYKTPGLPELVIDGEETAHFDGDRISLLADDFPPEAAPLMKHWFDHYGSQL
ncbi:MAG: nuclear transport factor 2 family protein [Myxococcota bacterium]